MHPRTLDPRCSLSRMNIIPRLTTQSILVALILAALASLTLNAHAAESSTCVPSGEWRLPGGAAVSAEAVLGAASAARVVLLGESHNEASHHRWQLQTLAALYRGNPKLSVGVEMFPRSLQPVLDDWTAGRLSDSEFLQRTDWERTWGYDAEMYLPIFRFARDHGLPLRALNVDRTSVRAVATSGWQALDAALAVELGTPAPPLPEYLSELRETFDAHAAHLPEGHQPAHGDFERFTEAQLLWDRAMASGIASSVAERQVVALMGSGHLRFGHGVPHQLRDLGVQRIYSLIPWDAEEDCTDLREGFADAVAAPI